MTIKQYHKSRPRDVYSLLWNSKEAQKILTREKVFDADSVNITNPMEVQYLDYIPNQSPYKTSFGISDFLDFKYEKLQEFSKTVKYSYLADIGRRVNPYISIRSHLYNAYIARTSC